MNLVSVIIPMRNGEPFIASTLRTILGQHDVELEVIVIDDGSTDASPQTVNQIGDPRVRMIKGPQRGISAAFNAGLAEARGVYLARCDADDLYPPGRLAWQVRFMDEHPDFGAVAGAYATIDTRDHPVSSFVHPDAPLDVTDELLAARGRSHMCAYLFRTDVLRQVGGCREWFVTSEDADLQFRLSEVTRVGYKPIESYLYRLHDASITHTQADARRKFYERCASTFLQQRRSGRRDDLELGTPPTPPTGGEKPRSTNRQIASMLIGDAWRAHQSGSKKRSLALGWRAACKAPMSLTGWVGLMKLALKPTCRSKTGGRLTRM